MLPENDTHDRPMDKVVMQQTMAKCGKKTMMPLVGGLCLTADFDQMWPKMCPSLEDFVTQRTSQELKKVIIGIYCIKKCLLDLDPI